MGDLINSRYRVQRALGQGGMSVVYLAVDERLKREVALKVLHPHLASRPESKRRFLQEATAIARLEHPHILKIYDYASPEDEQAYIVSQLIRGETLKAWAERHTSLPCEVVMLLCQPIFAALAHAHAHRIIHRDVKPENMMIQADDGAPILMDFGIAHLIDEETLTATGAVIGSPAHMAPEIVNGEPLSERADLFSMGTVMYWLCCDALPFVAPNPAALFRRILEARFDPVHERRPETFAPFARLIERCMKRAPEERPQGAREVAQHLQDLLSELGLSDLPQELTALSQDAPLYLQALPKRLTSAYLASARRCVASGDAQAALERLERLLSIDEAHEEALALQASLLSAPPSRLSPPLFLSLGALSALAVAGVMWWMSPQVSVAHLAPTPSEGQREVNTEDITNRAGSAEAEAQAEGPPVIAEGPPVSAQGVKASTKATLKLTSDDRPRLKTLKTLKRGLNKPLTAQLQARRAKSLKASLKRGRLKSRQRAPLITRAKRKVKVKARSEGRGHQLVSVRSRYKGASVWLDGARVGRVFEVERSAGLKLSLGGEHVISFRSPYCEEQREQLSLGASARPPIKVVFECRFKPSVFKVRGPEGAEIYLRGARPLRLGLTNQEISYKMTQATERLSLLVVARGQVERPLSVKVTAGKLTEVSLR